MPSYSKTVLKAPIKIACRWDWVCDISYRAFDMPSYRAISSNGTCSVKC